MQLRNLTTMEVKVDKRSTFKLAVVGSLMVGLLCSSTSFAQPSDTAAASPPMTKNELRAKRKADRAAARAKNKSELKSLEKNGFDPSQNAAHYPENLQNAEQKKKAQTN